MALRKVKKNWKPAKKKAEKLQKLVAEKFDKEKLYKGFVDAVLGFDSSILSPVIEDHPVVEFE